VAPGPVLAGVVEQPLRDILPDGVAAASAVWISTVRSQRRQETRSTWRWISASRLRRICALLAPAQGSLRTESQYSAGRGASGAAAVTDGLRAASAVSFSICFGLGMRQLAGRSVISR
jgi:hypothetical protein